MRADDPGYARFQNLVRTHKLEYRVTGDRYLEVKICSALPRGLKTVHHEWDETASRLKQCIGHPHMVDQDGYYAE